VNTSMSAFDHVHPLGEPATSPIAGLPGRLAALLFLAGIGHARHRALPDNPADPHSDAFNRGFKVERTGAATRIHAIFRMHWKNRAPPFTPNLAQSCSVQGSRSE